MFNPGLTLTGFRTTKISQSAREKLDIYQSYCKKGYFDQFKALKKKNNQAFECVKSLLKVLESENFT